MLRMRTPGIERLCGLRNGSTIVFGVFPLLFPFFWPVLAAPRAIRADRFEYADSDIIWAAKRVRDPWNEGSDVPFDCLLNKSCYSEELVYFSVSLLMQNCM